VSASWFQLNQFCVCLWGEWSATKNPTTSKKKIQFLQHLVPVNLTKKMIKQLSTIGRNAAPLVKGTSMVSVRNYARARELDNATRELLSEAMKDYLRKTKFPRLSAKKSKHDIAKEKALADQYSFQLMLRKSRVEEQIKYKKLLKSKALDAMPTELRKEAVKIDYSQWPVLLHPVNYVLPPQEGFLLPEEPAKNEL
jgi:hypothetical protein